MDERAPGRRVGVADAACKLEREFYWNLSGVIQKWERDLAALEEDERRQVVLATQEIGLLRVILDARIAVERYERSERGGQHAPAKAAPRRGNRT